MAGGTENDATVEVKKPQQTKWQGFLEFLYNKKKGTVLGRTPSSWGQITVFYIILYAFLTAFFAACLAAFLATLNDEEPKFTGKGTIIGVYPGMGYQPWIAKDPDSTLIHFNASNATTYADYVLSIKKFLKNYDDKNNTRDCDKGMLSNADLDTYPNASCVVDVEKFLRNSPCNFENDFGFKEGKPCVIVTLNRLMGWRPLPYPHFSAPDVLHGRADKEGSVAIHCVGEYYADQDNIGKLEYYPPQGLSWKYFPYRKFKNYHSPFAFVKFVQPSIGVLSEVECHAYAYNIKQDQTDRLGMVHFEMLVDAKSDK